MVRFITNFARDEQGSVSTLAAISIIPVLLAAALLIDTGSAWISRTHAQSALESAAAVAAMHRPSCSAGEEIDSAAAAAAFTAAAGESAAELHVTCTSDGVEIAARTESMTSLFATLRGEAVMIGTRANAVSAQFNGNSASGWSRS